MKLVIADNLEPEVIEELKKLGEVVYKPTNLTNDLKDADIFIVRSATKVTKELLTSASKLKVVARAGVGLDNVDVKACEARGIKVINTPSSSSNAVAELTIGLIISMLRNVQKAHHQMKNKIWDKKNLTGEEIEGKTLGIIGYGRIGSLVAKKAKALGMIVLAYDPKTKGDGNATAISIDELFKSSDIISLHTILTPETKDMIDIKSIAKMKSGVYLVNLARGDLIDETALYEACKSGKIAGAALDVYKEEPYSGKLLELENVYFTPHLGAATKEAQLRIGKELVEKIRNEIVK
ncbi:MAG: hydroxyacid dehydrogenase [Candidatus Micrarchaeota archaeon]|nr:hydroxyacid dehydrogenase [Candidatus Micrarchaeota archaeon]